MSPDRLRPNENPAARTARQFLQTERDALNENLRSWNVWSYITGGVGGVAATVAVIGYVASLPLLMWPSIVVAATALTVNSYIEAGRFINTLVPAFSRRFRKENQPQRVVAQA